jgi:hypothetical protein
LLLSLLSPDAVTAGALFRLFGSSLACFCFCSPLQ